MTDKVEPEVISVAAPVEAMSWQVLVLMLVGIYLFSVFVRTIFPDKIPDAEAEPLSPLTSPVSPTAPISLKASDSNSEFTPPDNSPGPDLPSAGTDVFTPASLAEFDGKDDKKSVYVAIKGTVFDVTKNRSSYCPGASYHMFAGKDASRALGKSSLNKADCVPDTSGLTEKELETLDKWESFYRKKYPIVGTVA
ncbi:hypothetical protein PhCBS80983_g05158 [Powellomyces hirtus]|uniref:Cytochrome b5 heme-binding domain-containing protein n=1 Tax=Powellomyces hirtus TaxID=109895 RepID=A0A507DXN8_9FUNG|nr:cytochrome b5-like heme/steroid binding domain-containing protein [Powellomyces hirtus]TPX55640.1 hypothetical protein PhCBS80983_g05158 [Powellomyces hirtus]